MMKGRLNPFNDFAFQKVVGEKGRRDTAYRLFKRRPQTDREGSYRAGGNP
jgi:hypothetical protein